MDRELRVEFHCHTYISKDCVTPPQKLIAACYRRGIDRLVITDHNSIAGAVEAREHAPELVIVGEEIMTTDGELLAAYVKEVVPRGLPPLEAIQRLRDQGAFISVSHPFDEVRNGHWRIEALREIVPLVDAIEVFNARCMQGQYNDRAREFAWEFGLPGTAGSDAHAALEVGRGCLMLPPFQDGESLRRVISSGRVIGVLSSPWVHFLSAFARLRKRIRV